MNRAASVLSLTSIFVLMMAGERRVSADVRIVSEVTVSTTPGSGVMTGSSGQSVDVLPGPPTVVSDTKYITEFKGHKVRRETEDGSRVVLFDRDTNHVYALNTQTKTYYVLPFDKAIDWSGQLSDSMAKSYTLDRQFDFQRDDDAGVEKTRAIVGLTSDRYSIDGTIALNPKRSGNGGSRGGMGRHRGGGGGEGFLGRLPRIRVAAPHRGILRGGERSGGALDVSGTVWCVDAESVLPDTGRFDSDELLALTQQVMSGAAGPLARALTEAVGHRKLLPLAGKVTVVRATSDASQYSAGANPTDSTLPDAPPAPPKSIYEMQILSIDTHATIDDALFSLPDGYQLVDAPAPPAPLPAGRGSDQDSSTGTR